jgi:hypothetical protein
MLCWQFRPMAGKVLGYRRSFRQFHSLPRIQPGPYLPMRLNTYWHTSRDAPPTDGVAVVLGVQDGALHIILDSPSPVSPTDPTPRVTVTTDRDETLRWHGTTGVGSGGIGGRYLHVAVFDPPPPESQILHVVVVIGDVTVLADRVLPVRTSSEP